jgi:hypothetical protein
MVEKGRSADTSGLWASSLEGLPMSKAERLHRWADNLELQNRLERNGAAASPVDRSPLRVALEDWAFRAEGLCRRDALAFFDLSADEMKRIVGTARNDSRTTSRAATAARVRALAEQAERTLASQGSVFSTGIQSWLLLGWEQEDRRANVNHRRL